MKVKVHVRDWNQSCKQLNSSLTSLGKKPSICSRRRNGQFRLCSPPMMARQLDLWAAPDAKEQIPHLYSSAVPNSSRWLDRLNLIHGMSKQPHVFARVSGWGMDHVHVSLSELFVCFANTRHHFVSWNWTIGSFKMHWSSMCSWQNQCVSGCYSIGNDTIFYCIVQKKAKVRSRHIYVNANRTSTRILTLTGMCTLCKVSLYAFTRFLGLNIHAWLLTKQNDHKSKAPTNPAARKQNQTQQNQAIKHALTSYKKITFPRPTTPTHMLSRRQQQSTKPTFWWQFHWTLRYARWVPSCISSPFRCRRPECSCEEDK